MIAFLNFPADGAWRSLEAHLNGVQGVAGSNPVAPTINLSQSTLRALAYFISRGDAAKNNYLVWPF